MGLTLDKPETSAALTEREAELVAQTSRQIAAFVNGAEESLQLTIKRNNGEQTQVQMPGKALQLLAQVLGAMAQGEPVTMIPQHAELTTHQAAALLNVSRPYLIKLLDARQIPYRKVGAHRRIRYEDLRLYMDRQKREREEVLRELVADNQRLGLYDE